MKRLVLIALLTLIGAIAPASPAAATAAAPWPVIPQPQGRMACPATPVHCDALVLTGVTPDSSPGLSPLQFHSAYALPCRPYGRIRGRCSQPVRFGGQTIAIVDAGGDKRISADLNQYDAYYGLPVCTKTNGCLTVVNQAGRSSPLPPGVGWGVEIALDVEIAHAICQTCRILLVEADNPSQGSMADGVNTAVRLGANEVSNSYSHTGNNIRPESYNHPGVAIVTSSGDDGWTPQWPASLPTVIAVGGTTLHLNADGSYASESAWSSSGSGCSDLESAQRWQWSRPDWPNTGCGSRRGIADVSIDGDPQTGAEIVAHGVWYRVGGTSLSAPLIAGIIALAGGMAGKSNPQSVAYHRFNAGNSHDIQSGSNGSCGTSICQAGNGYDGPTGLGSPNGISGFEVHVPTATPRPTHTPLPTPPVPTPTRPSSPVPTSRPIPPTRVPTSAPPPVAATATARPTATSLPTPVPGPSSEFVAYDLALLNATRIQYGRAPLVLDVTQGNGAGACVGSLGHSLAMATSGSIWHSNPGYPAASFPAEICVPYSTAGENVGSGSAIGDPEPMLAQLHAGMMREDTSNCATVSNHACNILNPAFTRVGIGIVVQNGAVWLTQDFMAN